MLPRYKYVDLILLSVISLILFFRSLDIYFLSENIGHIEGARELLTNFQYGTYFRPVWALTLVIDNWLWGMNHAGYHFSNLLFHTLSALLVYLLAHQLIRKRFFALASSLLFLTHPIHSLSIFWISGRTDVLCAIFYLSSLILFISFTRNGRLLYQFISVLLFALALASKEMAVSLPVIIFMYAVVFVHSNWRASFFRVVKWSAPHFAILILFALFRFLTVEEQAFANVYHSRISLPELIKNLATYFGLLIIPGGHIAIADFLKANPSFFWLLSILLVGVALLSGYWIRKSKHMIFFSMFIFITLLPVIRLIMRWYLYIPSVGFCLAMGYGLNKLSQNRQRRKLAVPGFMIILILYIGLLQLEQQRWLTAGDLSKKFSYQIASAISEQRDHRYYFLNVPAELQEVPVMIFGIGSLINFRLRNDFSLHEQVEINPLCYVSLANVKDMDRMRIHKLGEGIYQMQLMKNGSNFIFPYQPEIVSKRKHLQAGDLIETNFGSIRIVGLNEKNEAVALVVEVHHKSIPVFYYQGGEIFD